MFIKSAHAAAFALVAGNMFFAVHTWAADRTLIRDVTVISAERRLPLPGVSVLIEDGKIVSIAREIDGHEVYRTIEGNGRYLTPGLIDSHVHLGGWAGMRGDQRREHPDLLKGFHRQEPLNYLAFGFTTLIDVSTTPAFVQRWNNLDLRPDLHYCVSLPFANGYGMAFEPIEVRFETPYFLYDEAQADKIPQQYPGEEHTPQAVISKVSGTDAICVKTYYETGFGGLFDFPVPTIELMREVVNEAHENDLVVLMHGNSLEAQEFAAESGADILAHGAWHWDEWNGAEGVPAPVRAVLDDVVEARIATQATAQVIYGELDLVNGRFLNDTRLEQVYSADLLDWYRSDDAGWFRRQLLENYTSNPEIVQKFLGRKPSKDETDLAAVAVDRLRRTISYSKKNDATFLFGTDTPSSPTYTNPPGYNGLLEIKRLAELGLDEREIFEALTLNNAKAFNLASEIGTVEVGKTANLLLLEQNPLETIAAYDTIKTVLVQGRPIDRRSLLLSDQADNPGRQTDGML